MLRFSFSLLSTLGLLLASAGYGAGPQKVRVAIANFGWDAVHDDWYRSFGSEAEIGRGIRSRLTTRLVQGGAAAIVERQDLQRIIDEQTLGRSDRTRAGQGPRGSQLSGADYYLLGSITIFGRDDKQTSTAGGMRIPGGWDIGKVWGKEAKMVVAIDYRLVNAETGEAVDAGEARGESRRTSRNWGDIVRIPGMSAGATSTVQSENFGRTIIGEATMDCVEKLAAAINAKIVNATRDRPAVEINALVAKVSGRTVFINAGASKGVQSGQHLIVEENRGEIKDPQTGRVIGYDTRPIGTLAIDRVLAELSSGTFSPSVPNAVPKPGDIVRSE